MLQTTSLILEEALKKQKLNNQEYSSFLKLFSLYKLNKWVYPGAIRRYTKIDIKTVYIILNELEKNKILKSYFEVYCECGKTVGEVYENIGDIPIYIECENCGSIVESDKHAIIIYKVINI